MISYRCTYLKIIKWKVMMGIMSYGFHGKMKKSSKYCISDAQYKAKYYISEHINNYPL